MLKIVFGRGVRSAGRRRTTVPAPIGVTQPNIDYLGVQIECEQYLSSWRARFPKEPIGRDEATSAAPQIVVNGTGAETTSQRQP
jgi:hypothetical protein